MAVSMLSFSQHIVVKSAPFRLLTNYQNHVS